MSVLILITFLSGPLAILVAMWKSTSSFGGSIPGRLQARGEPEFRVEEEPKGRWRAMARVPSALFRRALVREGRFRGQYDGLPLEYAREKDAQQECDRMNEIEREKGD